MNTSSTHENIAANIEEDSDRNDFPLHCLPEQLASLAASISNSQRLPHEQVVLSMFSVLSSAIGTGIEVFTWNGHLRANIYVLIAAASGSGKSKLSKLLTQPLHRLEIEWQNNWRTQQLPHTKAETRLCEAKIKGLEKKASSQQSEQEQIQLSQELTSCEAKLELFRSKLHEPRMIVADATREVLAINLSMHPSECLASICSEARGVIDVLAGRYNKNTNEDLYLSAFSGDPVRVDRVSRPAVQLHRPCLSLLWMVQPDKLDLIMRKPEFSESGFLPRFLFIRPNIKIRMIEENATPIDPSVLGAWNFLVDSITRRFYLSPPVTIHPESGVNTVMRDFANEVLRKIECDPDYLGMDSFLHRWAEYAWKLLLIMHVCVHKDQAATVPLSVELARNAVQIMKWLGDRQRDILTPVLSQRLNERYSILCSILQSMNLKQATLRDMERRHSFNRAELERLAREHPQTLEINRVPSASGPGRPSVVIQLTEL